LPVNKTEEAKGGAIYNPPNIFFGLAPKPANTSGSNLNTSDILNTS
jgi:hypothetical protein